MENEIEIDIGIEIGSSFKGRLVYIMLETVYFMTYHLHAYLA